MGAPCCDDLLSLAPGERLHRQPLQCELPSMSPQTPKKFSLPVVPVSFIVLLIVGAVLYAWLWRTDSGHRAPPASAAASIGRLEPLRTPGGKLHTNGLRKTEELNKETGSWRGTTSSRIRLEATYRYDIELRPNWNIHLDDARKVAVVIAPAPQPQLPVAFDSATVQEWTASGWGRFDKWDQLQALRQEISPFLAARAGSRAYLELARGDARRTVEEFIEDWLLKSRQSSDPRHVVKVYFADESGIPFPERRTLKDFLP